MEIELSSLFGQDLYTDRGIYVGKIQDVTVDIKEKRISGLAVKNVNPTAFSVGKRKGVIIPYRWVTAIGDIVLIKHVKRRGMETEAEEEPEKKGKGKGSRKRAEDEGWDSGEI
jgi:sporulation protein YlmC with PRC-barrel domain